MFIIIIIIIIAYNEDCRKTILQRGVALNLRTLIIMMNNHRNGG